MRLIDAEPLEKETGWLDGTCLVIPKQSIQEAPTVKLQGRYLLITTDGFSLDDYAFYDTLEEAQSIMREAYERCIPEGWDKDCQNSSYYTEMSAMLYVDMEEVYLWNIIPLIK